MTEWITLQPSYLRVHTFANEKDQLSAILIFLHATFWCLNVSLTLYLGPILCNKMKLKLLNT